MTLTVRPVARYITDFNTAYLLLFLFWETWGDH